MSALTPSSTAPGLMLGEGVEIGVGVSFGAHVVVVEIEKFQQIAAFHGSSLAPA